MVVTYFLSKMLIHAQFMWVISSCGYIIFFVPFFPICLFNSSLNLWCKKIVA